LLDGMRSKETSIHKKQMIDGVKVGFLTQREVDNSNGKFYFDELTALEERLVSAPSGFITLWELPLSVCWSSLNDVKTCYKTRV
jgi:hypothetical protein